jgi:hypothetical protein
MSHRTVLALATALASISTIAISVALAAPAEQGTAEERDACRKDTVRLCANVKPEDGPMLNCLQTNRAKLSAACRNVLERHRQ